MITIKTEGKEDVKCNNITEVNGALLMNGLSKSVVTISFDEESKQQLIKDIVDQYGGDYHLELNTGAKKVRVAVDPFHIVLTRNLLSPVDRHFGFEQFKTHSTFEATYGLFGF